MFGFSAGRQSAAQHGSDCVKNAMISDKDEEKKEPVQPAASEGEAKTEEKK